MEYWSKLNETLYNDGQLVGIEGQKGWSLQRVVHAQGSEKRVLAEFFVVLRSALPPSKTKKEDLQKIPHTSLDLYFTV